MKLNKYLSDFDIDVDSLITFYENGEISYKVFRITLGVLFNKYYGNIAE